jgi:hypothetical protein
MSQKDDPTIERIREARHSISEAHGHDPQRLVEYYIELQKKYAHQLLDNQDEDASEPLEVQR